LLAVGLEGEQLPAQQGQGGEKLPLSSCSRVRSLPSVISWAAAGREMAIGRLAGGKWADHNPMPAGFCLWRHSFHLQAGQRGLMRACWHTVFCAGSAICMAGGLECIHSSLCFHGIQGVCHSSTALSAYQGIHSGRHSQEGIPAGQQDPAGAGAGQPVFRVAHDSEQGGTDLAEAGILLRFAGDGTYVAERKAESPLLDINNIAAEVEARGHTHSADVHQLETIAAGEEIALQLGVKVGTPIYHSILVHREDGLPIQLEDRYVNPAWAPDYILQDFTRRTPNEYLMETCPLTDIEHSVEAILPDARELAMLDITAGEPACWCCVVPGRTRIW
jgi:GntR family histidine utilization transcriptional repressor